MEPSRRQRFGALAVGVAVLLLGSIALARAPQDKSKASRPSPARDLAQYVGSEACQACHEDIYKSFEATPHWKTLIGKRRSADKQGCEACHGGGAEHVAGGGDKDKIFRFRDKPASQLSARCLECHEYGEEHSNFQRTAHNANNVSCLDCHSAHHAKQSQFLLTQKQPQLCYSCHAQAKADFAKPFRHRVNENLVKCSDCHNPHGGFQTKQLRATAAQDVACFKCHVEKAGPFVFEHAPVKTEGCVACHTPHGSSNPRLLKRSQVNLVCLECHTLTVDSAVPGIPGFHNQAQKYQACTVCHMSIHGSNVSPVFFK